MNIGSSQYGGSMLQSRDMGCKKQRVTWRERALAGAGPNIGTRHPAIRRRAGQRLRWSAPRRRNVPRALADALRHVAVDQPRLDRASAIVD
jgi:hypothetical protein